MGCLVKEGVPQGTPKVESKSMVLHVAVSAGGANTAAAVAGGNAHMRVTVPTAAPASAEAEGYMTYCHFASRLSKEPLGRYW